MKLLLLTVVITMQLEGWDLLNDVRFKSEFSEELEAYVDIPTFGLNLQTLDGQRVKIKGHYIPAELKDPNGIILSKFPYAACFFCGGAGLEPVVEVHFSESPRHFKPDEVVTVEGTLKLNRNDFEHLVFILKDAKRMIWEDREQKY